MSPLTLIPPRAIILICGGLLTLLISACRIVTLQSATPTSTENLSHMRASTITPEPSKLTLPGRTMGDPNAKVTLVVYADFQCPYSKQYTRDVEGQIVEAYVRTNKINYTYKYFPVIDQDRIGESHWAAYAAECANEQGKFWEYHDKLFYEYRGQSKGAFTRDHLKNFAAELDLDTRSFNTCLDSDKYAALVYDQLLEALQMRLLGTPYFLLNGRKMDTPTLAYDEFWKPIEAELKAR